MCCIVFTLCCTSIESLELGNGCLLCFMWIILQAKEKSSRLYEIYCRYLLSYDTLSAEEKKKLEEKVLNKRERDPSAFDQPCIVKVTVLGAAPVP